MRTVLAKIQEAVRLCETLDFNESGRTISNPLCWVVYKVLLLKTIIRIILQKTFRKFVLQFCDISK